MRLIVLVQTETPLEHFLRRELPGLAGYAEVVFCSDAHALKEALSPPRGGLDTALLAPDLDQLKSLGWLSHLSHRVTALLVLPDHHPRTTGLGHALRPRFITYADANWQELIEVLQCMAVNTNKGSPEPLGNTGRLSTPKKA